MIPPLPDRKATADVPVHSAASPENGSSGAVRFADLVARDRAEAILPTLMDAREADALDASARVFNEDGFFGHSVAAAFTQATSPSNEDAAGVEPSASELTTTTGAIDGTGMGPMEIISDPLVVRGERNGRAASQKMHGDPGGARATSRETDPSYRTSRRIENEAPRARQAARPAPVPRRWQAAAGISVAVAIQAVARGLEVSARATGLDAAERERLADEIAALLSSHGYTLSRVSVITAADTRAASQENR